MISVGDLWVPRHLVPRTGVRLFPGDNFLRWCNWSKSSPGYCAEKGWRVSVVYRQEREKQK